MTTETFAQALARIRSARGFSLRDLGRLVNYSRQYVHDVETGRRRVLPALAGALDQALAADGYLVHLAAVQAATPVAAPMPPLRTGTWRHGDAEALAAALVAEPPTPDNALQLAHEWLVTEPPQRYELRAGRHVGVDLVEQIEHRIHQIRLVDDHAGGLDTHAMVSVDLAATAEVLRDGSYTEATARRLLAATAELCQIAGWIASDAGRHGEARRLYLAGARAAHAAGDAPGAASNLSSLAYQIANVGDPREAVLLARSAYRGAEQVATATTRALLLDRAAWTHARAGDADSAERTLGLVDEAYADRRPEDGDPIWVYWLTPDEVEVMAGRVWTQLHRPLRAVPALEYAIAGYGDDRARETALYLTWLAESLVYGKEPDRAADVALRALRLARRAGSARASARIEDLCRLLQPYRGQAAVDAFLKESRGLSGGE